MLFQPARPCEGATSFALAGKNLTLSFNPRARVRARLKGPGAQAAEKLGFNPRARVRARLGLVALRSKSVEFQPARPCEGAT